MKKDYAFSGLEAAIVLIAFVVVAAVFSYVMLGAGFFATQKSQEVTYSGIKQATSNMVLDGQIYGRMSTAGTPGNFDNLQRLTFYLAIPQGGQAQNLETTKFIWTVGNNLPKVIPSGSIIFTPSDAVLSPGSKVKVEIIDRAWSLVQAGGSFGLEIKPNIGASTLIRKTLTTGFKGGYII